MSDASRWEDAWKILTGLEYAFTDPAGSECYQHVSFYRNSQEPWGQVVLDGEFTARQLQMIVGAMLSAQQAAQGGEA